MRSKSDYSLNLMGLCLTVCAMAGIPGTTLGQDATGQIHSVSTDWPQWRGPNRDGLIVEAPAWPTDLKGLSLEWETKLGPSYSGPIVTSDRVFTTETLDKKVEVVRAFDRASGRSLWQTKWDGAMSVPFFAKANGDWIRATPAFDGEYLYVAGMRDVLVCLRAEDGQERWRVDFVKALGTPIPAFGFVSSPLVVGDYLYVQAAASFIKLNKADGSIVWRTLIEEGGMMDSAFSSPVMASLGGKAQLVVQTRMQLAGVNPEDGVVLWTQDVPNFRGMNILTPVVYREGIFTSTYKNRSYFYSVLENGGDWSVKESWNQKAQGYMSSPLLIGDHIYMHLGNGRFTCLDLRTGDERWRSNSFGEYGSLVGNGNRVLALVENGELVLFDAVPEQFQILDRKKVSEEDTWAHLALSGRQVFVRALGGLKVFRW